MAEYSITANSVLRSANSTLEQGLVTSAGTPVAVARTAPLIYQLPDDTWQPAKADGVNPAYKAIAWALNDAGPGQPLNFVRLDPGFTPGFAIAVHEIAILSWTTAGKLRPIADLATAPSGAWLTLCLFGIGGNKALLQFVNVNAPKA